jgi:hypothetical protein
VKDNRSRAAIPEFSGSSCLRLRRRLYFDAHPRGFDPDTGNLTLNSTATNRTAAIATGTEPIRIDFDPTGKFLYVTNEASAASIYSVNSDGTLTNAGTTGVPTGALSTAITARKPVTEEPLWPWFSSFFLKGGG